MPARLLFALGLLLVWTQAATQAVAAKETAEPDSGDLSVRIGFEGKFKRGEWTPVSISTHSPEATTVRAVAPDSDGLGVVYQGSLEESASGSKQAEVLIRVGQRDAPIELQLVGEATAVGDAIRLNEATANLQPSLPADSRLLVECRVGTGGAGKTMLEPLATSRLIERPPAVAKLAGIQELPLEVDGYAAIDCLFIVVNQSDKNPFQADSARVRSLKRWVRLGGRLVIAYAPYGPNSESAPVALGGTLTEIVPAKATGTTTLADAASIERFAGASAPVAAGGRLAIPVVRFEIVRGEILAQAADLPLIVRQQYGFGEVIAVAFDPVGGEFSRWEDSEKLLARLCGIDASAKDRSSGQASGALMTTGYTDLSGALYQRLGSQFLGVGSSPFLAIVIAVLTYLALIGPGDYFLVRYGLKRMELTWITFPVVALLFGGGAYWLGGKIKTDNPRANQLELVDFDVSTNLARGTVWGQVYSPQAARYEVSLEPRGVDGKAIAEAKRSIAWWGLSGSGLGGLESTAGGVTGVSALYLQPESRERILGLPINIWSTKAVTARWHAEMPGLLESRLVDTGSGLVEGSITNTSDAELAKAVLIDGDWAWRLGDFSAGETLAINERRAPIKLKTLIRRDYMKSKMSSDSPTIGSIGNQSLPAVRIDQLNEASLLLLMMLHDALGGEEFTTLGNNVQRQLDLSRLVDGQNAMLIAHGTHGGSRLLNGNRPWSEDGGPVIYRFVLPVEKP